MSYAPNQHQDNQPSQLSDDSKNPPPPDVAGNSVSPLEDAFAKIYQMRKEGKPFYLRDSELHLLAKEYEIPFSKLRNIFKAYCCQQELKEQQQRPNQLRRWLKEADFYVQDNSLWVTRLMQVALTSFVGFIGFIIPLYQIYDSHQNEVISQRRQREKELAQQVKENRIRDKQAKTARAEQIKDSWDTILRHETRKSSSGRIEAIQFLNEQKTALYGINLSNAYLVGVNLPNAKMTEVNLDSADLNQASFEQANLNVANLRNAKLYKTNLTQTRLHSAQFSGAKLIRTIMVLSQPIGANFSQAELRNVELKKAVLRKSKFIDSEVKVSDLSGAELREVQFNSANVFNSKFIGADLSKADFAGANLYGSDFTRADLNQTNFEGANLEQVNLTDAKNMTLEQLEKATNWQYALYSDEFRKSALCEEPMIALLANQLDNYLKTKDFGCFSLYGSNLLKGQDLSGGDLSTTNLTNANLQNANLTDVNLQNANLICTDLRGVIGLTVEQVLQGINVDFAIYDDGFREELQKELELKDPETVCNRPLARIT